MSQDNHIENEIQQNNDDNLTPSGSENHAEWNYGGIEASSLSVTPVDSNERDTLTAEEEPHTGVKRELGPIQIFFILVSGTVGLGLFTSSGKILSIAGPWGALLAFAVVGLAVACVMQGITEMINYWPVSNALVEFVNSFVDKDLGFIVGFAYWCSYSITFATLICAATDLAGYWNIQSDVRTIAFNLLIPGVLLVINLLGVKWYGVVETIAGCMKVLLVAGSCILMVIINTGAAGNSKIGLEYINAGFRNDPMVAVNPAVAVLVVIPMASYAFCGVEILAVVALEAKDPDHSLLWWPTKHIARIVLLVYFFSAFMFYLNVSWQDSALVSFPEINTSPASIIMIAATNSEISVLPGLLNGCLIMTVLSAANTALYVASRTLYALTRGLKHNGSQLDKFIARLATTHTTGVPTWSLMVSAVIFGIWLPWVHSGTNYQDQALQEILSGIAVVGVIMVWAFQCIAFIRFRRWLGRHKQFIKDYFPEFQSSLLGSNAPYSWFSKFQPLGAWIGLTFCVSIVVVFSTTSWYDRGESTTSIIAAWVGPGMLFLIWGITKLIKRRGIVELSGSNVDLRDELNRLNNIGASSTTPRASNNTSKESSRQSTFARNPGQQNNPEIQTNEV